MEFDEIKQFIEILQDTDITELNIEREGAKLLIKREKFAAVPAAAPVVVQPSTSAVESAEPAEVTDNYIKVTSPIVGIYYTASTPEAPPFVKVGSHVVKGEVLCIVEAMKLMNEIESDTTGTIVKMLVENGQPVEYGEPLFLIEPV